MHAGEAITPHGGDCRSPHGAHARRRVTRTRWLLRGGQGPNTLAGAGPYRRTVGVPAAAARWPAPLSTVTTSSHRVYTAAETSSDWPHKTEAHSRIRAEMDPSSVASSGAPTMTTSRPRSCNASARRIGRAHV